MPEKIGGGGHMQPYSPNGEYGGAETYQQNESYQSILKKDAQRSRSSFDDKYTLTRNESVFLAKKKWDENIYCGMKMENRAITFPQTKTILNGMSVSGVRIDDIQAIINMRDAWNYLLKTIDEDLTVQYSCELHSYIGRNEALEWGVLRTGTVGVGDLDYKPPIPNKNAIEKEMSDILESDKSITSKALDLFLLFSRGQFFWDGNKRTAMTVANKLLIQNGRGMMIIPEKRMEDFNNLLSEYYETGVGEKLKFFLYDYAIIGIDY